MKEVYKLIMVNYSDSIGLDLNTLIGGDMLNKMVKFRSLDQMLGWALSICLKLKELNLTTKMTSSQKLRDRAVGFIKWQLLGFLYFHGTALFVFL